MYVPATGLQCICSSMRLRRKSTTGSRVVGYALQATTRDTRSSGRQTLPLLSVNRIKQKHGPIPINLEICQISVLRSAAVPLKRASNLFVSIPQISASATDASPLDVLPYGLPLS